MSSSERSDEYDWIFDFVLQFLESEKFDAFVMDFVDEKCFVFVDEEENKFIYSEIHKEFCEHIESLITSNLNELGITTELFVESCRKAKDGRDINSTVFERLTAMDDFQTFKKIMTKRNTELQLESIRNFKDGSSGNKANLLDLTFYRGEGKEVDFDYLLSPDELKAAADDDDAEDIDNFDYIDDEDVRVILKALYIYLICYVSLCAAGAGYVDAELDVYGVHTQTRGIGACGARACADAVPRHRRGETQTSHRRREVRSRYVRIRLRERAVTIANCDCGFQGIDLQWLHCDCRE